MVRSNGETAARSLVAHYCLDGAWICHDQIYTTLLPIYVWCVVILPILGLLAWHRMHMQLVQCLSDGWELRYPPDLPDPRLVTVAEAVAVLLTVRPRAWTQGRRSCTHAPCQHLEGLCIVCLVGVLVNQANWSGLHR